MKTFLLTLFSFLALVALATADNAAIFGRFFRVPIMGKCGQLNTNLKLGLFNGVNFSPAEAKAFYGHLKQSIGSPIGQKKNAEIAHAIVFASQVLKNTPKPIKSHSSAVLKAITHKIIADFQSKEDAYFNAIWASFDKSAKHVIGNKYTASVQAKIRANIKKVVHFWANTQVKSFCKVHCAALPPNAQKQLN